MLLDPVQLFRALVLYKPCVLVSSPDPVLLKFTKMLDSKYVA